MHVLQYAYYPLTRQALSKHAALPWQGCAFCGPAADTAAAGACVRRERLCPDGLGPAYLYSAGCPSRFNPLVIACLLLYLAAFSPGLGPVPWAVNSEIFPLQARLPFTHSPHFVRPPACDDPPPWATPLSRLSTLLEMPPLSNAHGCTPGVRFACLASMGTCSMP